MSPKGNYKRKPETIQKLKEQMTAIGKGRKGKKYASTEPHAQPMEEMTPKPPEQSQKVGENNSNNNINKDMVEEKKEETPDIEPEKEPETEPEETPEPPSGRPLTGPEIREQQEKGNL